MRIGPDSGDGMGRGGRLGDEWVERLVEQSKILGEARMLRDDQELTDELGKAVIQRFNAFLERAGKSQTWAARSLGISGAVLSAVVAGSYTADAEPHIRAIDKWLEQQLLRETAPKPAGFCKIKVVDRIYAVARFVQKENTIGLVHGPAGVGKTMCLQAIRAETPGSLMVRITTCGQSKANVMETIAQAASLTGLRLTSRQLESLLVQRLKDSNRLIIVDEIHKLEGRRKDEALHALRDLHDETGCPMLWAGMTNIANYIQQGQTRWEPLDQLASRIGFWLNLTDAVEGTDGGGGAYSIEDVRKIISTYKLRVTPDGERWLHALANTPRMGALRSLCRLLRLVAEVASEKQVTANMLRSIRGQQLGQRAAEQYEREMESWAEKIAAAG